MARYAQSVARELDEHSEEAGRQRTRVRKLLREQEAKWQEVLADPGRRPARDVARSCARAMELCSELGRLDEVVAAAGLRAAAVREEMAALRSLCAALAEAEDGTTPGNVDLDGVRYSRAERKLYQLVGQDHAATEQRVLSGPVQHLSDAVTSMEVIERAATRTSRVVDDVHRCRTQVAAAHAELQGVLDDLRPPLLDEGLAPALRALVKGLDPAIGRFDVIGDAVRPRPALELSIFRIAQEAVANAIAHGRAEHIDVLLSLHAQRITLIVRDDGEGFDVAATEARFSRTQSVGVLSMRQRAELGGGSLDIRSIVDHGTEVRAIFPVGAETAEA